MLLFCGALVDGRVVDLKVPNMASETVTKSIGNERVSLLFSYFSRFEDLFMFKKFIF